MSQNRHHWKSWASTLHQWGMENLAAAFLEAAGPLSVLGAQAVYLGQPILTNSVSADGLEALACMLEDAQERRAFVTLLREVASHERA